MKRMYLFIMLVVASTLLFAEAPNFEVYQAPLDLGLSYYDYCPGSYVNTTVQRQSDEFGGTYMLWHRTPTQYASRRVYQSYYNGFDQTTTPSFVDLGNYQNEPWEGYPGIDVDPDTGIPFYAYHVNNDADGDYEAAFGWDNYMFIPGVGAVTGMNSDIGEAWDNTQLNNSVCSYSDFIWPYVFVMDHPTDAAMKRIVVFGNNASADGGGTLVQADNLLIATLDINANDANLNTTPASNFNYNWEYQTIPELDAWAEAGHRAYITVPAVTEDGEICVFGNVFYADGSNHNQGIYTQDMYIVSSNDFAETFNFTTTNISNRLIGDNNLPQDYFDPDNERFGFHWSLVNSNHMNAVFGDDGKVRAVGNVSIMFYVNGEESASYLPAFQYPKSFLVDPVAGTISIEDIYPLAENGLFKPWDVDEDGEYDVNEYGDHTAYSFWPHWDWRQDDVGATNYFRITKGEINGDEVFAAVWTDGYKLKQYMDPNYADPEYQSWNEVPEICISISTDGINYEEPVRLSAHETEGIPELIRGDGNKMVPVYVTASDRIIDAGNGYGRIGLMFFDDLSYGSYIQSEGTNAGGNLRYMEVDVDFSNIYTGGSTYYGDIDENGSIQAYDASVALQYAVGLDPIASIDPRPWENDRIDIADVDGNNTVQAYDASLILQYVVGLIDNFPVERNNTIEQISEKGLQFSYENGNLIVHSSQAISALELTSEDVNLGTVEALISDAVLAQNENKIGLCSAENFAQNTPILSIPISTEQNEITLSIVENTYEYEITIPLVPLAEDIVVYENKVFGNHPNPFNPTTIIQYSAKNDNTPVSLEIYNIKGQKVKSFGTQSVNKGNHSFTWNGNDNAGNTVSSGVYFYRIQIGEKTSTRKMMLMK